MADVFISYSRADEKSAARVAKALQSAGFSVWWDADLPAHRTYSDVIETNLRDSKAVVVLWSADAAKSQWVRAEADLARNEGKLVQASLDGSMPPLPFNQIQCASLKGWRGSSGHAGWRKLSGSVSSLVSGKETPSPSSGAARWWNVRRNRLALAAIATILLLATAFVAFEFLGREVKDRPVVAVLPFESLDNRDESLVAGIWEDTRQAIGRNPQLMVLGPNTAEEIADKGSASAKKLADYLVEASVRSSGDRIRVNANLVRTDDGSEIWNKSFDRRLDDVFQLQQEIAGEIEGHIRGRLAERGGIKPENIATSGEVYALYSDARAKIRKRQPGKYDEAHKQLQQVVRMDPNFAPGWATLAVVKGFGFEYASTGEADARRAIALAPNLAAGHAALGFVLGRGPAAEASLRRALELDPNDIEAIHWLANSMDPETRRDEKLQLYSRVIELEPLWWPAVVNKINLLLDDDDKTAIEAELARVETLGDDRMTAAIKAKVYEARGDLSGAVSVALAHYKKAPEDRELMINFLMGPLFQLGLTDIGDRIFPPPTNYIGFIRTNDPRALDLIEAQHSPQAFWRSGPLPVISARVYLMNNQGPRLARRYRAVASTPAEFEKAVGRDAFPDIAPGAALALRSAGDEEQAQELLALAETIAKPNGKPNADEMITLARIYAVQGRTNEAIGQLSSALRAGWLPPFLPIHTDIALDPPLNELRKDPRFEMFRQQILAHLRKERAELGPVSLD